MVFIAMVNPFHPSYCLLGWTFPDVVVLAIYRMISKILLCLLFCVVFVLILWLYSGHHCWCFLCYPALILFVCIFSLWVLNKNFLLIKKKTRQTPISKKKKKKTGQTRHTSDILMHGLPLTTCTKTVPHDFYSKFNLKRQIMGPERLGWI